MLKKRVTSHDVARLAGVSRSVVSAVLNGTKGIGISPETREAVLAAIQELNYHVDAQARAMKTGKSGSIAAFGDTSNPLFLQVLEGMQKACGERGYHVLISGQGAHEEGRFKLIDLFLQRRIDGIVSLDPVSYADPRWAGELRKLQVPYVSVEGYAETDSVTSVLADYAQSVRDALDYMAACAAEAGKPVYVQINHKDSASNWAERSRRQAYLDWCGERRAEPVIYELKHNDGDEVRSLLLQLRDSHALLPPLLCNWSAGAIGIYRAAHELELRVGTDVRVMAADNTQRLNRSLVPSLSVMNIPYVRMGETAVHVLLQTLEDGERPEPQPGEKAGAKHWLKAELLAGKSMAPIESSSSL